MIPILETYSNLLVVTLASILNKYCSVIPDHNSVPTLWKAKPSHIVYMLYTYPLSADCHYGVS